MEEDLVSPADGCGMFAALDAPLLPEVGRLPGPAAICCLSLFWLGEGRMLTDFILRNSPDLSHLHGRVVISVDLQNCTIFIEGADKQTFPLQRKKSPPIACLLSQCWLDSKQ